MKIEHFSAPPFMEETYLVWDESSHDAILIDPGSSEHSVDQMIHQHQLKLQCIANTHGHVDHIACVSYFQNKYQVPFYIHSGDAALVAAANQYASFLGFGRIDIPTIDGELKEGQEISVGNHRFVVYETPGHTPGGCVFYCAPEKVVIVGDLLFNESVGRTDFPGGDFDQLARSIREKVYVLPDETVVLSGHGPSTAVGHEKRHNPFVKASGDVQ